MKSQVLHTVWCNISGDAAGETNSTKFFRPSLLLVPCNSILLAKPNPQTANFTVLRAEVLLGGEGGGLDGGDRRGEGGLATEGETNY